MNKAIFDKIFYKMHLIRQVEETIAARYSQNDMRCPTHLSTGQECVPAVLGSLCTAEDLAVSTHRSHAHYLGKGGNLDRMIAELYGKKTGCSAGLGGSMHLIDIASGFMGSTAIVGGTIPVGVGLGLSLKQQQKKNIALVFMGDGAIEEGVFYESINFALLQKCPVLFVCENNLYSVYSPLSKRQPAERSITSLVKGLGINAMRVDGNNIEQVYEILAATITSMREYAVPAFIEFKTYRWREHCGPNYDNYLGYRPEEEFLEWQKKDPLIYANKLSLEQYSYKEKDIANLITTINQEIENAFTFAQQSEPMPYNQLEHFVYAS